MLAQTQGPKIRGDRELRDLFAVQDEITERVVTRQSGPGGVREPAGRLDHVVEGSPRHALHQGDDLCALRPAARRAGLALSLSRLGRLLGPPLRLRRGLLLALAVVADADRGRACGGDLEPDPPALLVTGPVRLIALDPDLLQKPELAEHNHRRLDGCGSHALRQDRKAVLAL